MNAGPHVAVVIVNYRTPELALRCLEALRGERKLLPSLTAILVDGGSDDGSAPKFAKAVKRPDLAEWVTALPLPINGGYGWANNQAILELARRSRPPEFIHVLNPDTEVMEGAVAQLADELGARPECGAVGSQLLAPNGRPVPSAFRFPSVAREFAGAAQSEALRRKLRIPGIVVSADTSTQVDWVTGASVMFRSAALQQVGLFDDGFFLYFEEVELMHRLRKAGWAVRLVPDSRVVHIEGAATGVGAGATDRPYPAYWYQSRRRYHELAGGSSRLAAANLALLAGHGIAVLKSAFGRQLANKSLRTADLLRFGFWPSHAARHPSPAQWGDAPGKPPAWMARL